jgi:CBS domain-containing protein
VLDALGYADRTIPSIGQDDSIIKAVVALKAFDVPAIAVTNPQGKIVGVFTGYNLMTLLHKIASTPEKLWAALYKTSLYDIVWFTLSAEPSMTLKDLVARMLAKRWGHAVVLHGGVYNVISILDVARLLVSSGALEKIPLTLSDIATENVVTIGRDSTVHELIDVMIQRRIRRILLEEENYVITDRTIHRYLVSDPVLQELRDSPSEVLETSLDALLGYAGKPAILSQDAALSTALRKMVEREPYTVLTEDRKHILTPWDITKLSTK